MRGAHAFGVILLLCAVSVCEPARARDLTAEARALIVRSEGGPEAFEPRSDGAVRHKQSGLVCVPQIGAGTLKALYIYPGPQPGLDVGCDYIRREENGAVSGKLTVFATKRTAAQSLESLFTGYEREIRQLIPDAKRTGREVALTAPDAMPALPTRAAHYTYRRGDQDIGTVLIVSIVGDWGIEVRATYPAGEPGDPEIADAARAWRQAVETVGHSN